MTTFARELVTCGVCGTESDQVVLTSTSSFGPPDLDLRPAQPERGSLFARVQRCPDCGFCAPALGDGYEELRTLVESDGYRATLRRPHIPELARAFLCAAMVLDDMERESEAVWAAIEAAWVCDDERAEHAARVCRERAIDLFHESDAAGEALVDELDAEAAVRADVLRRAGRFEEAADLALSVLAQGVADELVVRILSLEIDLASARDDRAHSVAELEERDPTTRRQPR